jgi:hypothetical protein
VRLRLESAGIRPLEQTRTITLDPATSATVEFSLPIGQPGLFHGCVEVAADDGFAVDNRRYLAFEARAADRLLLVDGEPGTSVFSNETYYLETALRLALPGKGSELTPYVPEHIVLDGATRLPNLEPYRVVALCNATALGRLSPGVDGSSSSPAERCKLPHARRSRRPGCCPARSKARATPDCSASTRGKKSIRFFCRLAIRNKAISAA